MQDYGYDDDQASGDLSGLASGRTPSKLIGFYILDI